MRTTSAHHSLTDMSKALDSVRRGCSADVDRAIDILFDAWLNDNWVYIMGNGGSASTATHFAGDLAKTICDRPGERGLKAIALADNIPLISASTNDWGWDNIYHHNLTTFYQENGVGIGISVHGGSGTDVSGQWSQNLLKGLQFIKDRGGRTIGLSGFDGGPMCKIVDAGIVVKAESTPIVEGLHVVLLHVIVFGLKDRIRSYNAKSGVSR